MNLVLILFSVRYFSLFLWFIPQLEKRKQEEKMKRDQLNDQYLDLVEKQRLYFKTVKDFKEVGVVIYDCIFCNLFYRGLYSWI
jgi:hypothetical protein